MKDKRRHIKTKKWHAYGSSLFKPVRLFFGFVMVMVFSFILFVGTPYLLKYKASYASPVPIVGSFCPPLMGNCGCATVPTTAITQAAVAAALDAVANAVEDFIEDFIRDAIDDAIGALLTAANVMEHNIMDWWTQLWEFDMKPSFQNMTAQLHTGHADQSRQMASFFDAQNMTNLNNQLKQAEIEAARIVRPSTLVCMAATQAAGFSRANTFVRAMRFGMEDSKQKLGLNSLGTLGANGINAIHNDKWDNYRTIFCNNQSNKGITCAVSGVKPDADIRPTATLINPLTIDMQNNAERIAAETAIDNIAGVDVMNPVRPAAVNTTHGQRLILEKRERLAKRAAARSVNMLTTMGWRSRGSDMNTWVNEFNQKSGSNIVVSPDPSYHEVMHALTKYKFLSGHYGEEQVEEPINIEREKLVSSSLYLMQLRDYYELLERVALTAAVDTSILLDEYGNIDNSSSSEAK